MERKALTKRLLYIHQAIQKGTYPSVRTLAEICEVSEKTIKRDIDHLKTYHNASIKTSQRHGGYYYEESAYELPAMFLTEGELSSLLIFQQVLPNYKNTPFEQAFESLSLKLMELLPDKIKHNFNISALEHISLHEDAISPVDVTVWQELLKGLTKNLTLNIKYHGLHKPKTNRKICPYHVVGHRGAWYVIALDVDKKQFRIFSLSRIITIRLTTERFTRDESFDENKYIDKHFGIYFNKKICALQIRCNKNIARVIQERVWHPSQKVENKKDGSIILKIKTTQEVEVLRWIKTWGSDMEIIKPQRLREKLKSDLQETLKKYT